MTVHSTEEMTKILEQLLRHMLNSNPKILYSPSGSDVDDIINNVG